MTTKKDARKLKTLVALLKRASRIADELEVVLSNGAEVGSLVGSTADELELLVEAAEAEVTACGFHKVRQ